MATKILTLISIVGLAGVGVLNAQSPTPSGSPDTSPSPAKHRAHKKAETSPSPAAESTASASPAKQRRGKKSEASPSPTAAGAASESPAAHKGRKKAETSPTPVASATPANPISAIGSLFKPKTSPTAAGAKTKAETNATPAPGGGHGLVWVNTETHVYHKEGSRFYGKTKKGKYTTEADAQKEGDRAAKAGE